MSFILSEQPALRSSDKNTIVESISAFEQQGRCNGHAAMRRHIPNGLQRGIGRGFGHTLKGGKTGSNHLREHHQIALFCGSFLGIGCHHRQICRLVFGNYIGLRYANLKGF